MTYILFGGCSFTAESYYWMQFIQQDNENLLLDYHRGLNVFPAWPEILTNQLNKKIGSNHECVNVAVSGDSNQQAIRNIFDYVGGNNLNWRLNIPEGAKEKPEAIVIGLTEWTRFIDIYGNAITCSLISDLESQGFYDDLESFNELEEILIDWHNTRESNRKLKSHTASTMTGFLEGNQERKYYRGALQLNLDYMEMLILYCRAHDIKLLFCQILSPWWSGGGIEFQEECAKRVNYECDYLQHRINTIESYFNESCKFLNQKGLDAALRENVNILAPKWRWSTAFHCCNVPSPSTGKPDPYDQHPNKEGHEYIASLISKDFNALFNH